jgi:hypothetical protein
MSGALWLHPKEEVRVRVPRLVAVLVTCAVAAGHAAPSQAAVVLTAPRTELLYSSDTDVDCSELFKIRDPAPLPRNVARITAVVTGATDPSQVRVRWFLPRPETGVLAADLNLGPQDQTSAVTGMCADFGNACVLTEDRLRFYREQSILWVAPTCADLPKNTSRPFRGDTVRIRAKAFEGKRRLGRATITLGYGRDGSVTLYAWDGRVRDGALVMDDGIGKSSVGVPLNAFFGARPTPPADAGPIADYVFDNGAGEATVDPGCFVSTTVPLAGCADIDYHADGRFFATVAARFADKSALCDAVTTSVRNCSGDLRLDVLPRPRRDVYTVTEPIDLVVRVTNISKPTERLPACGIGLEGVGMLSCVEEFKTEGVEDTRTTTFALRHCSRSQGRGCNVDADCQSPVCPDCEADEICLTQPHCSEHFEQACNSDFDCENTPPMGPCPQCDDDESCIRFLNFGTPSIFLRPGESVDLLQSQVMLRNEFGSIARMRDTWTVTAALQGISAQRSLRYRIRARQR